MNNDASIFNGKYVINESGCWEWTLYKNWKGYGKVCVKGEMLQAHRVMWSMHNGEIPDGMCVLHKCDNRSCINPDHLFIGTPADNSADMVAKRRSAKGESVASHKLTASDVVEIREAWGSGRMTQPELASKYGIDHSAVSLIVLRKRWAHVGSDGKRVKE